MSELKRPERYLQPESIKPKLSSITDFYTQKINEYWNRIKQLNEYADALENEISVLKETPKVEVLLDDMPKPLVVVPQIMADFIEVRKKSLKLYDAFQEIEECYCGDLYNFVCQKRNGQDLFARAWLDGYTVEKEQLYEIRIPLPNGNYASIDSKGYIWGELIPNKYKLTESEVKNIDERYWAFAVPV